MAISIGDALLKVGVDKKDFERDMKGLSGAINRHKKAIGVAMVGMGVAAIGAATASVKAFADMGDEVQKMAIRTGFSTEALSELRHAAEISGASLSTMEKGVKRMSGTILDAQDGLETYIRAFEHIGIEVEELEGLKPEDQFLRIAEAIAEVEDPTKRAAIAQDIFGRAGTELLPLFAAGKEGLAELREEAHKLGIVFDKEAADSAAEFKDNLTRLNGAVNGLKFTLAKELMPSIEAGIPIVTSFVRALGPWIENALNWHAAHDKQIKQQRAWADMAQQRLWALQGINNEYEASVDALESVLKSQGQWNDQTAETIRALREEIEVRGLNKVAIEGESGALEERAELLREQEEASLELTDKLEEMRKEYDNERTAVGKLDITTDDITNTLFRQGWTIDELKALWEELGDDIEYTDIYLKAAGITIEDVIELQERQARAIERTTDKYKEQQRAIEGLRRTQGGKRETHPDYGAGVIEPGMSPEQVAYAQGINWDDITPSQYKDVVAAAGNPPGYAQGGIAMSPMLARVAEKGPELMLPMDKFERMMGGKQMMTIIYEVDGRQMARAIMPYAVGEIRIRTAGKI